MFPCPKGCLSYPDAPFQSAKKQPPVIFSPRSAQETCASLTLRIKCSVRHIHVPALYKSPPVVENSYSGAFLIILLGFVEYPSPPEYFGKHLRRVYHNRSVVFSCELNLQSHPALAEQVAPASWFPNRTCGFPSHPALRFIPYSTLWLFAADVGLHRPMDFRTHTTV